MATTTKKTTIPEKALFYHLVRDHGVITADIMEVDAGELHEALHDLMHFEYRIPVHTRSFLEVARDAEKIKREVFQESFKKLDND